MLSARVVAVAGMVVLLLVGCAASPGAAVGASTSTGSGSQHSVVGGASRLGPAAPGTTVRASARCPAGRAAISGGASTLLVGGHTPPSSLHVLASFPVAAAVAAGGGAGLASWDSLGATGGQLVFGGQTTSLVVCTNLKPSHLQVVAMATLGPSRSASTAQATATCPAAAGLVSGGAAVTAPGSSPSLHLIGSFPSGATGTPSAEGSTPTSWTAVADAGGRGGGGIRTTAYAVCGTITGLGVARVVVAAVAGPRTAATALSATAACPAGTTLVGGGADTGLPSGQPPQQGIHLTGTFPSPRPGPNASGIGAWTARAESGGQPTPGIVTAAFALCAPGA